MALPFQGSMLCNHYQSSAQTLSCLGTTTSKRQVHAEKYCFQVLRGQEKQRTQKDFLNGQGKEFHDPGNNTKGETVQSQEHVSLFVDIGNLGLGKDHLDKICLQAQKQDLL